MKITLKIQPELLFLLHILVLECSQRISMLDFKNKAKKSMLHEIFETLARSCVTYHANTNGKPRKLTLRYHLANQLYEMLIEQINNPKLGIYERNKLDLFKNDLHRLLL